MLLDRAASLTAKIDIFLKFKNTVKEAGLYFTRANQFNEASEMIARLRKTLSSLNDAGVAVAFTAIDGEGYASKAKKLREVIVADPNAIKDPPFDVKYGFIDRLSDITKSGEKAASAAWKTYVDQCAGFGSDDVLVTLGKVPQFGGIVTKIRQIRFDVAKISDQLPEYPNKTIANLKLLLNEHESAWKSLDAEDIPKSVSLFIRAASNSDATLSQYTAEVQKWLENRDLLSTFRIKLR